MKLQVITIVVIFFGLLTFYTVSDMTKDAWQWTWFFWDDVVKFLLAANIFRFTRGGIKYFFAGAAILFLSMLVWDVIVFFVGTDVNNRVGITILFFILAAAYAVSIHKTLIDWYKDKSNGQ